MQNRLGTAYGLMTMIQNVGLTVCQPGGGSAERLGPRRRGNPDGYRPMLWMFTVLSTAALLFSALLRQREDGPSRPRAGNDSREGDVIIGGLYLL